MKNNIMIDIETFDSASTAAIVSIGAAQFDIETGEVGLTFYVNVDLQSCMDSGLTVSASTIMWWLSQDKQAKQSLLEAPVKLHKALHMFEQWIIKCGDCKIWANAPSFDCVILKNAFSKCDMQLPWKYYNEMCVRTLSAFNPQIRKNTINDLAHDALADCLYQIKYCSEIWNTININK